MVEGIVQDCPCWQAFILQVGERQEGFGGVQSSWGVEEEGGGFEEEGGGGKGGSISKNIFISPLVGLLRLWNKVSKGLKTKTNLELIINPQALELIILIFSGSYDWLDLLISAISTKEVLF